MGYILKSVIAISLMGLIAVIGLAFIGDKFNEDLSKAQAIKTLDQGNHVVSSARIFEMDNSRQATLSDIISNTKYTSNPAPFSSWTQDASGKPFVAADSIEHCEAINSQLGYEGTIPSCAAVPTELQSKNYYCCAP